MLSMLLAYDADGNVIATLDHLVVYNPDGTPHGLVDFEAVEAAGPLRLREDGSAGVWSVPNAAGSCTWPEWLGAAAHDFRVELDGPGGHKRAVALVHRMSGHRRHREVIETAIAERIVAAHGSPADIRDIVGGPEFPLELDVEGKTIERRRTNAASPRPLEDVRTRG